MSNPEKKVESNPNSGFMFGLTIGAAVGALSTIMINKSNQKEIVQNFESKIKEFFQDFVKDAKSSTKGGSASSGKRVEIVEDQEPVVVHKKTTPKMFVKPKK